MISGISASMIGDWPRFIRSTLVWIESTPTHMVAVVCETARRHGTYIS